MRIAFYDDDPGQRESLRKLLLVFAFERNIEAEVVEYGSAPELLEGPPADLLLLDIKLEEGQNGIEIARELRRREFSGILILITSAPEFALEGYQADTFRYLVKPLQKEELFEALSAALRKLHTGSRKIAILAGGARQYLKIDDIQLVESYYHICRIHTQGRVFETKETLRSLGERLPRERFASPHKSFLVNLSQVASASATRLVLGGGREIPISRNRREEFLAALHHFILRKGG